MKVMTTRLISGNADSAYLPAKLITLFPGQAFIEDSSNYAVNKVFFKTTLYYISLQSLEELTHQRSFIFHNKGQPITCKVLYMELSQSLSTKVNLNVIEYTWKFNLQITMYNSRKRRVIHSNPPQACFFLIQMISQIDKTNFELLLVSLDIYLRYLLSGTRSVGN